MMLAPNIHRPRHLNAALLEAGAALTLLWLRRRGGTFGALWWTQVPPATEAPPATLQATSLSSRCRKLRVPEILDSIGCDVFRTLRRHKEGLQLKTCLFGALTGDILIPTNSIV